MSSLSAVLPNHFTKLLLYWLFGFILNPIHSAPIHSLSYFFSLYHTEFWSAPLQLYSCLYFSQYTQLSLLKTLSYNEQMSRNRVVCLIIFSSCNSHSLPEITHIFLLLFIFLNISINSPFFNKNSTKGTHIQQLALCCHLCITCNWSFYFSYQTVLSWSFMKDIWFSLHHTS